MGPCHKFSGIAFFLTETRNELAVGHPLVFLVVRRTKQAGTKNHVTDWR